MLSCDHWCICITECMYVHCTYIMGVLYAHLWINEFQIIYRSSSAWGPVWDDSLNKKVEYNSRSIVPFLTTYPCFENNKKCIRANTFCFMPTLCAFPSNIQNKIKVTSTLLAQYSIYFSGLYMYFGNRLNSIQYEQKLYIYIQHLRPYKYKKTHTNNTSKLYTKIYRFTEYRYYMGGGGI